MKIKTYTGLILELKEELPESYKEKVKLSHGDRYDEFYTYSGVDDHKNIAVRCKKHGWFTITRKNFKNGSNCHKCARESQRRKCSEHFFNAETSKTLIKKCECCSKKFEVQNKSRLRDKKFCSTECRRINSSIRITEQNKSKKFRLKKSMSMKKEYATGKRNAEGSGRSQWIVFKDFKVQGILEYETCIALDRLLESGKIYKWEYTNDRIKYNSIKGGISTYLLDFKVFLSEDFFFYIETKGFSIDNDLMKWSKVIESGYPLKVFFQKTHIEKIKENPDFLLNHEYFSLKHLNKIIFKEQNSFKIFKPNKVIL